MKTIIATVSGIVCFGLGWLCAPKGAANEAGLIGIIAIQREEIGALKALVKTYESERGEIRDSAEDRAL